MSTISSTTNCDHDILLPSGYLREQESSSSLFLPDDIKSVVTSFSKQIYVRFVKAIHNSRDKVKIDSIQPDRDGASDELSAHIPDYYLATDIESKVQLFCAAHNIKPSIIAKLSARNHGIKLISHGIAHNSNLFVSTHNNKLYLLSSSSVKKIRIDFIADKNDEIIEIKNGEEHTLFLTKCGCVYSFGGNDSGQCGLGAQIRSVSRLTLVPFVNGDKIISVACGKLHSLFVNDKNELLVCGYNYCGQLGINNNIGNMSDEYVPTGAFSETDDNDTDSDFFEHGCLETYGPTMNGYFENLGAEIKKIDCGLFHSAVMTKKGECYIFGNKVCSEDDNVPFKLQIGDKRKVIDICCSADYDLVFLHSQK